VRFRSRGLRQGCAVRVVGHATLCVCSRRLGALERRAPKSLPCRVPKWRQSGISGRVLAQVLEQARKDLGANTKGLPDAPPKRGSLDIKEVLDAEYAFA
jgi:hypothetical protein